MTNHKLIVHLLNMLLLWILLMHSGIFVSARLRPLKEFSEYDNPNYLYAMELTEEQKPSTKLAITEKELNKSVKYATEVVDRLQRLEITLGWSNVHVKRGSPSHGQLINSEPEGETLQNERDALIAAKATQYLMNSHCHKAHLNPRKCIKYVSKYNLLSTSLKNVCPNMLHKCSVQELSSKYRFIDGSCNNMRNRLLGKSFNNYKRLLPSNYQDGVQEPRKSIHHKFALPSPRLISTSLFDHRNIVDKEFTLAVMQWGQFVEHDLAHTATNTMVHSNNTIECCDEDGNNLSPRYVHPFCAPINVPFDDAFYSKHGVECMSYVRSATSIKSDCTFGPIEQINQATPFLDGSQIYGSSPKKANSLREFHGGLLRTQNKDFLPLATNPTQNCQCSNPESKCFVSGDSRVNVQPQLTVMHTIWHREHNRVAVELEILNPQWDDEKLYQEARRIVIAELQRVTYNEWLPLILGKSYLDNIQLSDMYSEQIDPTTSNSFATAAIRFINSLVDGKLHLYKGNRLVNTTLTLRKHFNNPGTVDERGHLDALIIGLATQHGQKFDMDYSQDITNQLYQNGDYGYDIISLDIQRGRDHGLPTYVEFRKYCGLPKVDDFTDLMDAMTLEKIEMLMTVYRSPRDIDLLVGGMSETSDVDSFLGPTFSCIIADQMSRTKHGDRYFYTNGKQPKPFTSAQKAEIEKVTLARVFCDNGDDIQNMQPNVFKKISERNNLVSCPSEDIPYMNLKLWATTQQK